MNSLPFPNVKFHLNLGLISSGNCRKKVLFPAGFEVQGLGVVLGGGLAAWGVVKR